MKQLKQPLQTAIRLVRGQLHSSVKFHAPIPQQAKENSISSVLLQEIKISTVKGTKHVCPSPAIDNAVTLAKKNKMWPSEVEYVNGVLRIAAVLVAKVEPKAETEQPAETEAEKPKRVRKKKDVEAETEQPAENDQIDETDA
jgi:hypothetical protein